MQPAAEPVRPLEVTFYCICSMNLVLKTPVFVRVFARKPPKKRQNGPVFRVIENLLQRSVPIAPSHSSRSNIIGSTDSARRAGIQAATSPSTAIARTTPANTRGSRGVA